MKKLLILGFCLIVASQVFAGNIIYEDHKPHKDCNYIEPQDADAPVTFEKKPLPVMDGTAVGFYDNIPFIETPFLGVDLGIGYTDLNGQRSSILRAHIPMYEANSTRFQAGLGACAIIDSLNNELGVFIGGEQYLNERVSIFADLYPFAWNDLGNRVSFARFGCKLYQ